MSYRHRVNARKDKAYFKRTANGSAAANSPGLQFRGGIRL